MTLLVRALLVVTALLFATSLARAEMLLPEQKSYDFCQSYTIEDGSFLIVPYPHGFHCTVGTPTPQGLRLKPGDSFMQFDAARLIVDQYTLTRITPGGHRAYFQQRSFRYKVIKEADGSFRDIIGQQVDSNEFYLTRFRALGWLDYAVPVMEIHPGYELWRTRPKY